MSWLCRDCRELLTPQKPRVLALTHCRLFRFNNGRRRASTRLPSRPISQTFANTIARSADKDSWRTIVFDIRTGGVAAASVCFDNPLVLSRVARTRAGPFAFLALSESEARKRNARNGST